MQPGITAVLCTRNRPDDVERCLESILSTDADAIVVVDQSTDDNSLQRLHHMGAMEGGRLTYLASNESGLSRARNTALRTCRTELIVFTDDDCVVPPDWTSTIRRLMSTEHFDMLFAPVTADQAQQDLGVWIPVYQPSLIGRVSRDADPIDAFGIGANMGLQTSLRDVVGYFDEYLGAGSSHFGASEDTDYAYRSLKKGMSVGIVDGPAVIHFGARHGSERTDLRRSYLLGASAMLDKHARIGDRAARARRRALITQSAKEATQNFVRTGRPSGVTTLRAALSGIGRSRFSYKVDRGGELFVPRNGGPSSPPVRRPSI